MVTKVYIASGSDNTVGNAVRTKLTRELGGEVSVTTDISESQVVVASTAALDDLPTRLPDQVQLLQMTDCGGALQFAGSVAAIANTAAVLAKDAAGWAASIARTAADSIADQDSGNCVQVGVIGIGNLGASVVGELREQLGEMLGSIVVADIRTPRQQLLSDLAVRRYTLDMLLSTSDIVVVCVHHGPTSDPLLGPRELRLLDDRAWVIDASPSPGAVSELPERETEGTSITRMISRRNSDQHELNARAKADEVAGSVVANIARVQRGEPLKGVVEHVTFPSAGDPAFWSSRMSPVQA